MDIKNSQLAVDAWIKEHGVRYFDELTNMAQLTEEVGEVARIIARRYGQQSEKESDKAKDLGEELADSAPGPEEELLRCGIRSTVPCQPDRDRPSGFVR